VDSSQLVGNFPQLDADRHVIRMPFDTICLSPLSTSSSSRFHLGLARVE
jgi:hypothetical protein